MWSNATYSFDVELFEFFSYSGELFFNIFNWAPLKLAVAWYRPEYTYTETPDFWDVRLIGKYDLRGPYVSYSATESAKTFKSSFYDFFANIDDPDFYPYPQGKDAWDYNDESDYDNPDIAFEFLDLFFDSSRLFFYGDDITLFDVYALNPEMNTYFDIPKKPTKPSKPDNPYVPNTPDNPDIPNNPENPDNPVTPEPAWVDPAEQI